MYLYRVFNKQVKKKCKILCSKDPFNISYASEVEFLPIFVIIFRFLCHVENMLENARCTKVVVQLVDLGNNFEVKTNVTLACSQSQEYMVLSAANSAVLLYLLHLDCATLLWYLFLIFFVSQLVFPLFSVSLQPFEYDPNEKNRHKFMVQAMFAPEGEINPDTLVSLCPN